VGSSAAMMVVVTHPADPQREAEYNQWYSYNHLHDVMLTPNIISANRYRQTRAVVGHVSPYLALYQIDSTDLEATQNAFARQLTNASDWRKLPGTALVVDWWAYYKKIKEVGPADPSGNPPKGTMIVYSRPGEPANPTGIMFTEFFEEWYAGYLEYMTKAPSIRSSTLYRLRLLAGGPNPAPYLAVHELDSDDIDTVHEEITEHLTKPDDSRPEVPVGPDGVPMFSWDFWGYYKTLVAQQQKTLEELMDLRARTGI